MFFIGQNLSFLPYLFLLVTYLAGLSTLSFNYFGDNSQKSNEDLSCYVIPADKSIMIQFVDNSDQTSNNPYDITFCGYYHQEGSYFDLKVPLNVCFYPDIDYNCLIGTTSPYACRPPPVIA